MRSNRENATVVRGDVAVNQYQKDDLDILFVDDKLEHLEKFIKLFRAKDIRNRIQSVTDGEHALDYLFQRKMFADRKRYPMPGLVILDIRLPRLSGIDVLKIVKSNMRLRTIPIIILSEISNREKIWQSYWLGVNSYIIKPPTEDAFASVIERIAHYWFGMNQLPNVFKQQVIDRYVE